MLICTCNIRYFTCIRLHTIYTHKVKIATPSQLNVFVFEFLPYRDTLLSKETPSEEDWLEVLRPNEFPCDFLSGSTRVTEMFHNRPLQNDSWQCSRSRLKISIEVFLAWRVNIPIGLPSCHLPSIWTWWILPSCTQERLCLHCQLQWLCRFHRSESWNFWSFLE